jgi:deazaflavin-dependent oxidoreductase (nitroreductase family)
MRVQGRPLLELETLGARSGATRHTVVGWFPAESKDAWLVVASNAGSARHPAWFLNMARNPDHVWVAIGRRRIKVNPETIEGAERERAWREVVSLAPGYGHYEHDTDRVIPIVRLTAQEQGGASA